MALSNGTDAVLDDIFSYQQYNRLKNHWPGASAPSDPQNGMVWYDSTNHRWAGRRNGAWLYFPPIIPEGTIIPWIGGYFTDGANGGYTRVLGSANTVAAVNTLWNTYGLYVCDGAALNLSTSTIFNGADRYLPNLTDDRFLMGDTLCGGTGGANTNSHTHAVGTLAAANEEAHTHGIGTYAAANESAHTHAGGTLAAANNGGHGHGLGTLATVADGSHDHTFSGTTATSAASVWVASGPDSEVSVVTHDHTFSGTTGSAGSHTHGLTGSLDTVGDHSHSISGTTAAGSAHTHTLSGSSAAGSAHTHSLSGSTAVPSDTENRPTYLSVFYLMYVLAN
jgi:hypothetical protein